MGKSALEYSLGSRFVLNGWPRGEEAAHRVYTAAQLIPALRQDLHWRKQRLEEYIESKRGTPQTINQLLQSIHVGECVLGFLQRQPYEFELAGGGVRSLDVVGEAITEHLRRADPNVSGLIVRISFGTEGLYPVRLDLELLGE